MADQEEWSTDANEALDISFVQAAPGSPRTLSSFHPSFTYPIFGDEERIFGYQSLKLNLRFAAHDLYPNLEVLYDKKFKTVGDTKATDIEGTLKEWVPNDTFQKVGAFYSHIQNDTSASSFKPPGELLETYTSRGRNFEIWNGELTDPSVRRIVERLQIMISFFIEGGTPLQLDDQDWTLARWRVYFVYEKLSDLPSPNTSPYSIVGYSTSYRFVTYVPTTSSKSTTQDFTLPPPAPISPASLPSRARISQFLILPSHHSHGHGTHLYNAMVKTFLASPTCMEITVEDPNEAFDDLRDYCDYKHLLDNGTFARISLKTDIDPKLSARKIGVRVPTSKLLDMPLLETLRIKNKIAPRQFARLVELYLLTKIAPHNRQAGTARLTQRARASDPNDRAFYYWRLLVKQRVYKKNKDVLVQLDRGERVDKVEQTVGEVAGDYERLLRGMEKWEGGEPSASSSERRDRAKRKVVDEDDEDEDEEMTGSAKRVRSEAL
ncbi:MAG: histone acetyltransferase 1 [Alectoria fallacina]|uniref:Histone acetyltransferase type B catalytic subunit n=1 Tax=Alectoria fallacina TaxID=1903189 RepID=A0A8H3JA40_9LECA|nr:MAG: histone acetyltransferase 1 [Alectoria fallacina]